jgi:uncharacterized membrane protein YraQ (UPF0718 family)
MTDRTEISFSHRCLALARPWLFPLGVGCVYGIGLVVAPEKIALALAMSVSIFKQLVVPICLAVVTMVVFNRFLSPALVSRFLGRSSGIKGIVFSSLAGILSMGPIYAWYPQFQNLRDKGASVFHVANFMGCRAIKPVLLPVMVAYFGWGFTLLFMGLSLMGAWVVAAGVSVALADVAGSGSGSGHGDGRD